MGNKLFRNFDPLWVDS